MMQNVHITCRNDVLQSLVQDLEEQFAALAEEVAVVDYGYTQKQGHGYVVIEWSDEADEAFLEQLNGDSCVIDYCVYTVASVDVFLFGTELTVSEEREYPGRETEEE